MSTFTDHTEAAADRSRAALDSGSRYAARIAEEVSAGRRGLLRRGWRKITWAMIAWSALFVVGCLIALASGGHEIAECHRIGGGLGDVCGQAVSERIEAKVEHLLTIGVLGFLGLAAIWTMTKPRD